MTIILPIMYIAMSLGTTYDLGKMQRGGTSVYDDNIKDKAIVIPRSITTSQYRLVETFNDIRDFLNVDGELSLRIKEGQVPSFKGLGEYIKDFTSKKSFVELLVKVEHETKTETIPSWVDPKAGWNKGNAVHLGTHYVRSLTYGGVMLASLRLNADNEADREKIKASVNANLHFGGSFNISAKGNFDKVWSEVGNLFKLQIDIRAPIKPFNPVQTIEELMTVVQNYPEEVAKINEGAGLPIKAELYPISSLDSKFPSYVVNHAMKAILNDFEEKFEDIKTTDSALRSWVNRNDFDDETLEKIEPFSTMLDTTKTAFHVAIDKLDTSTLADSKQLDDALDKYGRGKDNLPHRFERLFWNLRKEMGEKPEWKEDVGEGTSYIYWGSEKCAKESGLIYKGMIAGANGFGSGSNLQCLPFEAPEPPVIKGNDEVGQISVIRDTYCALCRKKRSSTIKMLPGRSVCPSSWITIYKGTLVGQKGSPMGHQFLCFHPDALSNTSKFGQAWAKLPSGDYSSVDCVVCAA